MIKKTILFLLLAVGANGFAQQVVTGFAYEDSNKNGVKDRKEKGISRVAVSNGVEVVVTNEKGLYSLPINEDQTIFAIKPSGYRLPLDGDFIPKFYKHHKPSGSPADFRYKGVAPTGKLPKSVDFPLYKYDEPKEYSAVIFGDPQPYTMDDINSFSGKIIADVQKRDNTLFGISLGDIVGDNLDLHPIYKERMRALQLPWYNVMGNHDMNYDAKEDQLADESWQKNFGMANYAFNYGDVHYIILDNILFPDPRGGNGYWGGYREDQLKFLENNLKIVPKNKLVVLSQHIEMKDETGNWFRREDKQRIFDLLKDFDNVLILSAHTHWQDQIYYTEAHGWSGKKPLHEYNVGTTSGDWYSGKRDKNGFPDATMYDGTPQGYAFLNIKGNQYSVDYKVAGAPESYQMSIFAPKVVPHNGSTSVQIAVNFFMGRKGDLVEYKIDNGEWRRMNYSETEDPSYLLKLMEWDVTEELLPGRRPSNPEKCSHLWKAPINVRLAPGEHTIFVRATDQYGKTHFGEKTYKILEN